MQRRFLHIDDPKTWNAFRSGNHAAFAYIYQLYFQPLYSYGRRFSDNDALIGDTLQQLFTELWRKRKKLGATDHIRNYLYKSFRRALLRNLSKKDAGSTLKSQGSPVDTCLSYEAQLIQQQQQEEQRDALQRAIKQLSEKQKEVICLKFYDELSYAEISEIMEISPSQVYDYMYKALGSLRKKITTEKALGPVAFLNFAIIIAHPAFFLL